jgi:hypothetical protein
LISLAVGALLLALVIVYVGSPLRRPRRTPDPPNDELMALLIERENVVSSLRDLDEQHARGTLSDEAHADLRREVLAQGTEVLRRLDLLDGAPDPRSPTPDPRMAPSNQRSEAEVYAPQVGAGFLPSPSGRSPALQGRAGGEGARPGPCAACGRLPQPGDSFCAGCGTRLDTAPTPGRMP